MDGRFYASSDFGFHQFDGENIGDLPNNIVRVSQKLVLNDRGATHLGRELGKEFENVKEIMTIREIDCTANKIRIVGLIYPSLFTLPHPPINGKNIEVHWNSLYKDWRKVE